MAIEDLHASQNPISGGTGARLGHLVLILAGISSLVATIITFFSVWLQCKNYRKPLLQRYVVRILIIIPIYCAASFASLVSLKAAFWIEPFKDVYEAFTIYAFTQLLINFIGGERSLIIMMHGRPPVSHLWPLSQCLPKVDISDPHTFLNIKRGILQYAWIKPMLAIATIAMKATGTFKEGYIGVTSGYFWSGLIYNISITVCLYALALFWVCMARDLRPFRPMPKFLCIKGIIFASYWQGFFLSILVWLGAIPDVAGYSPDNLAASIQDALICFEMTLFAVAHWYAFAWTDYADITISAARLPMKYALRDAFGPIDLIQDAKDTFAGTRYEYRQFDAGDDVLAHEESAQRAARIKEGMRFSRSKGKYWIPDPNDINSKTPLLNKVTGHEELGQRHVTSGSTSPNSMYGATISGSYDDLSSNPVLDDDDEELFRHARDLEFGDWNYPVITAHNASREDRLYREPGIITASTNRHLLQATTENRARRKSRIEKLQKDVGKGKHRRPSLSPVNSGDEDHQQDGRVSESTVVDGTDEDHRGRSSKASHLPIIGGLFDHHRTSSKHSDRSQLVDLVVEDRQAEEVERVRARKEGSPGWNRHEPEHFVRVYHGSGEDNKAGPEEYVREGFEPPGQPTKDPRNTHTMDVSGEMFAVGEDEEGDEVTERNGDQGPAFANNRRDKSEVEARESGEMGGESKVELDAKKRRWKNRDYTDEPDSKDLVEGKEDQDDMRGQTKSQTRQEDFGEQENNPWADGDQGELR